MTASAFPANARPSFHKDLYLNDRATIVSFHFERSNFFAGNCMITFYFTGGKFGTHSITETTENKAAWARAEAHWDGYVAASNEWIAAGGR